MLDGAAASAAIAAALIEPEWIIRPAPAEDVAAEPFAEPEVAAEPEALVAEPEPETPVAETVALVAETPVVETVALVAETETEPPIVEPAPESAAEPEGVAAVLTEPETVPAVATEPEIVAASPAPRIEIEPEPMLRPLVTSDPSDPTSEVAAAAAVRTSVMFTSMRPGQTLDEAIAEFDQAEPEPVAAAEPESLVAAEPEPVVVEPEPEPVVAAEPGSEPVVEPESVIAAEPEPEPALEPLVALQPVVLARTRARRRGQPVPPSPSPSSRPSLSRSPRPSPSPSSRPSRSRSPRPSPSPSSRPSPSRPQPWSTEPVPTPVVVPPAPVAAEPPVIESPAIAAVAAPVDVMAQPTWSVMAPDPDRADPEWPNQQPAPGLPFLGRPAVPTGGVDALWAASSQQVASPGEPGARRRREGLRQLRPVTLRHRPVLPAMRERPAPLTRRPVRPAPAHPPPGS